MTNNAFSVNLADVKPAVLGGTDTQGHTFTALGVGDTCLLPSGTASWTTALVIPLGVNIIGKTVVTSTSVTNWPSTLWSDNAVATDLTIIQDDCPHNSAQTDELIEMVIPSGQTGRISGITFQKGTTVTSVAQSPPGGVNIHGSGQARVDNCHFNDFLHSWQLTPNSNSSTETGVTGVADHCVWTISPTGHNCLSAWVGNGGGSYGDSAWTTTPQFGTSKFWFFEDCFFDNQRSTVQTGNAIDAYKGGRYVVRYSTFHNAKPFTPHGTESPGRNRSVRAVEGYNIHMNWDSGNSPTGGQIRGGTALLHDIVMTHFQSGIGFRIYREFVKKYLFKAADGTGVWDENSDASGNPVAAGQPGHLFYTGTHTGANAAAILTDSGANFPSLTGYVIRNMGNNSTEKWNSFPNSNTSTTVTIPSGSNADPDSNAPYLWNTGDVYEIRKVLIALDQPGRGTGDLISGDSPNQKISGGPNNGTVAWPRQASEPIYCWNNINNGTEIDFGSFGEPTLKSGTDYFNLGIGLGGGTPSAVSTKYVAALNGVDYSGTFTYPHPLVATTPGKIIALSGNLSFGNVIINTQGTATLTITNNGDTTLTVSSITYPTGYSGSFSGTVAPNGGTHSVTVTFQPTLVQAYNGTITVNSDATSGTNTIPVTGSGSSPRILSSTQPERENSTARRITGLGRKA